MLVFPPRPEDFKFNEAKSPRLRIVSFSSAVATVVVRGVTKTGLIHDTYETVADRLIQTRMVELTEIPLGVQVETTTDAIQRGMLYFQIHLEFAAVPALTLGAGYITTGTPLTWPGGRHNPPTEGRGQILTEVIADPAVQTGYAVVTPANTLRRPIAFCFTYAADGNAASRVVQYLTQTAVADPTMVGYTDGTVDANETKIITIASFGTVMTNSLTRTNGPLPEIFLTGGTYFSIVATLMQAGDQFSNGRFTYEEWLNPQVPMPPPGIRLRPPIQLATYTHLSPQDYEIWSRFIGSNPLHFTSVAYDVRVGQGAISNPDHDDPFQVGFNALTKKRIDAIGFTETSTTIIEVKPRASVLAVGQAIVYKDLYVRTFKPTGNVFAAVLTDTPDPDLLPCCDNFDVQMLTA